MSHETLGRIFEPFFTTKEIGKGTGLGLASVYGIVKQHEGWIEVDSELGRGTTIRIFFPGNEDAAEEFEAATSSLRIPRGSETILVVDDEPSLRLVVRAILQDSGYQILEASNGVEAIQVYERHSEKIDLLFTDMVMPEAMTGLELAQELKGRQPDLRVVYSTGYSADIVGLEAEIRPGFNFLQKPYSAAVLTATVRKILDQQPT